MVRPADLPFKQPRWAARPLSPQDVWQLAMGNAVPGIDPLDPRIQSIQRARTDNLGRTALSEARQRGYLTLALNPHNPEWVGPVIHLWGWWCAAAGQPEIVITHQRQVDVASLRCDLSPTRVRWNLAALYRIGELVRDMPSEGGFILTPETVEFDRLVFIDALEVARELTSLAKEASYTHPG